MIFGTWNSKLTLMAKFLTSKIRSKSEKTNKKSEKSSQTTLEWASTPESYTQSNAKEPETLLSTRSFTDVLDFAIFSEASKNSIPYLSYQKLPHNYLKSLTPKSHDKSPL
jgi:hypothetical protein